MRFFLIIILLGSTSSQAALYKYKNKDGEVTYSDAPPYAGAEEMSPPVLQTVPAIKYQNKPKPKPEATTSRPPTRYRSLILSQPEQDGTIRNNSGDVSITLKLEPELDTKYEHYINFYLDGKIIKKRTRALSITLNNIDRGSHNIKAEVRSKKGKLLKASPIITFHLHRFSILHNLPPPTTTP